MKSWLFSIYFYVLNLILSTSNSWLLNNHGFNFPIFLTWFQSVFLACVFCVSSICARTNIAVAWQEILNLGTIALLSTLNVVFNNASLAHMSLGLNQIIRSLIPVATFAVSIIGARSLPTASEITGIILLSCGVIVSVIGAREKSTSLGVSLCLISVLTAAIMINLISKKVKDEKVSPLKISWAAAPISSLLLTQPFLYFEFTDVQRYIFQTDSRVLLLLFGNAILASVFLFVQNKLIQLVGPVLMTMLGQLKLVSLLAISDLFLENNRESSGKHQNRFSWSLTVLGFWIYLWGRNHSKLSGRGSV